MSAHPPDAVLLRSLFERENTMLVRFLTGLTHCWSTAEDLAQLTWLKLIGARRRGICADLLEADLRAYLYEVARNTFIDECTRKHESTRTRATDPTDLADLIARQDMSPSAEDECLRMERRAVLWRAMQCLPEAQRDVVLMWSSGESTDDMMRKSTAPYDTVLSRKKYAFARMRSAMLAAEA